MTPEEHHSKRVDIDTSPYDTNSIKHTLKKLTMGIMVGDP